MSNNLCVNSCFNNKQFEWHFLYILSFLNFYCNILEELINIGNIALRAKRRIEIRCGVNLLAALKSIIHGLFVSSFCDCFQMRASSIRETVSKLVHVHFTRGALMPWILIWMKHYLLAVCGWTFQHQQAVRNGSLCHWSWNHWFWATRLFWLLLLLFWPLLCLNITYAAVRHKTP